MLVPVNNKPNSPDEATPWQVSDRLREADRVRKEISDAEDTWEKVDKRHSDAQDYDEKELEEELVGEMKTNRGAYRGPKRDFERFSGVIR